ncbi:MAG TPA: hypothetical protein VFD56_09705 [Chitinophagaceae bacterium]|nr:hypothetical protein [Chitinophagaceae bacterium]
MKFLFTLYSKPVLFVLLLAIVFVSCQKQIDEPAQQEELSTSAASNNAHGHLKQTKTFSSGVLQKWLALKYRILLTPQEQSTTGGFLVARFYAVLGISLYESVVPGMPAYQSLSGQLIDMPAMPSTSPGLAYHWAASANAALAHTFRKFLPNTSVANKASIDSLEEALNLEYMMHVNAATFQRSKNFGNAVADLVFTWSNADGFFTVNPPYVAPVGPGLWVPTPPNFAAPLGPYWGNIRPLMPGVLNETAPPPPIPFSTDPSSAFFAGMQEVFNTRQLLAANPVLRTQALYWRGSMGGSAFILWYAMLGKILVDQGDNVMLDKAALAYCKMGIVNRDGAIAVFKAKYLYNELAPITYIRSIMGQVTWNSEFPVPSAPCYPEFHSPQNSGCAAVLTQEFGDNFQINTDGINPLGLPGYTFNSFAEAETHANQSRILAGVATPSEVNAGASLGNAIAEYMKNTIRFLKE